MNGVGGLFLDPVGVRKKKMNSNQTAETKGGIKARMDWHETDTAADPLEITLRPVAKRGTRTTLSIRFGTHEMTTTLRAIVE